MVFTFVFRFEKIARFVVSGVPTGSALLPRDVNLYSIVISTTYIQFGRRRFYIDAYFFENGIGSKLELCGAAWTMCKDRCRHKRHDAKG